MPGNETIAHVSALRHPAYRIYKIIEREMTLMTRIITDFIMSFLSICANQCNPWSIGFFLSNFKVTWT